ncbi:NADPH-cytochrome p450 [Cyclospora cayetanensis]|uniref:NADPH--hemoprotein reductase n=1 Tax=Cyclospora cayetanensis TaxID=88456 RepID=A0A1D3CY29_9EIME|nr:NADPH-cytochrome p450 [Cyclospora cayetanensis]
MCNNQNMMPDLKEANNGPASLKKLHLKPATQDIGSAGAAMGGTRLLRLHRLSSQTLPQSSGSEASLVLTAGAAAQEEPAGVAHDSAQVEAAAGAAGLFGGGSAAPDCAAVYILPHCIDSPTNFPSDGGHLAEALAGAPLSEETQSYIPAGKSSSGCCREGHSVYLCVHLPNERGLRCMRWNGAIQQNENDQAQLSHSWRVEMPEQLGKASVACVRWLELERGHLGLLIGTVRLDARGYTVGAAVFVGAVAAVAADPSPPTAAASRELRDTLQLLEEMPQQDAGGSQQRRKEEEERGDARGEAFSRDSDPAHSCRRRTPPSLAISKTRHQRSPSPQRRPSSPRPLPHHEQQLVLAAGANPLLSLHSLVLADSQETPRLTFFAVSAATAAGKLAAAAARGALSLLMPHTGTQQRQQEQPAKEAARRSRGTAEPPVIVNAPLLQSGWHDSQREALSLRPCPWNPFVAALSDSLGRVSMISVTSLLPIWMVKGYRTAQLAWLRRFPLKCTYSEAAASATATRAARLSGGLLVLAPKRGMLELFSGASQERLAVALNGQVKAAIEHKPFVPQPRSLTAEARMYIHFGTETGTAENISELLAARLRALQGPPSVTIFDLEKQHLLNGEHPHALFPQDFSPSGFLLPSSDGGESTSEGAGLHSDSRNDNGPLALRVLVLATHGEGDATESARRFEDWVGPIRKQLQQPVALSDSWLLEPSRFTTLLIATVVGLCSSNYRSTYNAMASRTYKSLRKACRMQEQLAALAAESSSCNGSSSGKVELQQLLRQLLPEEIPRVVGALGVKRSSLSTAEQTTPEHTTSDAQSSEAATSEAVDAPGLEAVRLWLSQHKAPTVVTLKADRRGNKGGEGASLQQTPQQRPASKSARFFFSMVPLPLLRTTDLMKRERLLSIPEATSAEVEAAGVECRELEFDLSQAPRLRCQTADTLYVLPRNPPQEVLWWFDFLGIEKRGLALEDFIHFADEAVPFPTPCTVEDALALYCGFALPSRAELAVYAQFATDPDQRSQWLRLTTDPKVCSDFESRISSLASRFVGYAAMLDDAMHCSPATSLFLQVSEGVPPSFSADATAMTLPQCLLCISMLRHLYLCVSPLRLPLGIRPFGSLEAIPSGVHEGLCSSYLLNLKQKVAVDESGEAPPAVLCCCRPSAFKLPSKEDRPLILVAAGTGKISARGCRALCFACLDTSLAGVPCDRKVYVQHKVVEEGQLVWGLLRAGAAVFVCGRPAMGKAVQEALLSVAASQIGQQKAEAFIKRLHDSGLYTEELWD